LIDFIEGEVVEAGEGYAVLKVGSFGIRVLTPGKLKEGERALLFTELSIPQEGTPSLYGFRSREERELFKKLTKVPKVGAKAALSILSAFPPEELKEVVISGDYERLTSVPGLGKKLSQRIVLELKGKLKAEGQELPQELLEVLKALGYSRREVQSSLKGINLEGLTLEEAVKETLKRLSGRKS